jgi:radical SAM protein with 4Fe4S-binding SPASM domain
VAGDTAVCFARLEVDQFLLTTPFDVGWGGPSIRPSTRAQQTVRLHSAADGVAERRMVDNRNPFPEELAAGPLEREFDASWRARAAGPGGQSTGSGDPAGAGRHTCRYLYKNMVMDATGRILPCGAAPGPDTDVVFGNARAAADLFNSEKYQLARRAFARPDGDRAAPHCARCDWYDIQNKAHVDRDQVKNYFTAAPHRAFNAASMAILRSC